MLCKSAVAHYAVSSWTAPGTVPQDTLQIIIIILQHLAASMARAFVFFTLPLSTPPFLFFWPSISSGNLSKMLSVEKQVDGCSVPQLHTQKWEVWLANGSSGPSARASHLICGFRYIIAGQVDCSQQVKTTLRPPGNFPVLLTGCSWVGLRWDHQVQKINKITEILITKHDNTLL